MHVVSSARAEFIQMNAGCHTDMDVFLFTFSCYKCSGNHILSKSLDTFFLTQKTERVVLCAATRKSV